MPTHVVMVFFYSCILLMLGMVLFTIGSEQAMEPMGKHVGARITKTRKLYLILPLGFLLGFMITISEPDLQVLANQVQSIPNSALILSVSAGVAFFLLAALIRMVVGISLQRMLLFLYVIAFALAYFAPHDFLAVAFDSGGVTTGPMTVPFIMAFGVGVSSLRGTRHSSQDSFGLIALCSIGPIIAVLLLSLIFQPENADYVPVTVPRVMHSLQLGALFRMELPDQLHEIAQAVLPIAVFFAIFQTIFLHLEKKALARIFSGIVYTYVGLVLFLTGANVGFIPAGFDLGSILATLPYNWIIIPIGMLIGYFIIKAEPAVYVLMKQVEDITNGAVGGQALQRSLSVGVAVSVGLAMVRVLTGIHIFYMLVPGYAIALLLTFIVPPVFTAIAFDSGGVASGPMTATFLLPFAMGACMTLGGNVVTDAFGVVTMVAMTPLITIQCLGLMYMWKRRRAPETQVRQDSLADYGDYDIIEL
ncbi:MAG: DUF1538 domain-containing protein [Acidaminococcaceae bacterium]|nr:DUF1538 domain-containing protein [Acidaminococcaceae bacterium]